MEILDNELPFFKNWNLTGDPKPKRSNPHLGIKWIPPKDGYFKLNFDGAVKGNPRKAGGGGVLRDSQGKFILAYFFDLGLQSNNVVEAAAMFWGVKLAKDKGFTLLEVEGDSLYIISCLKGISQPSISIEDFINKTKLLAPSFESISFNHVYREGNSLADYMENLGVITRGLKVVEDPIMMHAKFFEIMKREGLTVNSSTNEEAKFNQTCDTLL
ncbi:hypothetical protein KI387_040197 [Taxus chinensis]|uniref:RNase H type-1 domain-containing protein n=1 Tax=Taxus chinensis TaxID=29808 RepID=A0AA38CI89_TAXCH|nr:hypothetical protein KI387_040197 [Taxus chinensis]